ncbi:MAG: gamma-glutamyl-gamma-aminobutyrate hydrolase family protein, partial [Frankiaceae bacterium]|nr:gamma-glutamyl-gamma-aminobutyrate hydrolase family protein [Frankiaceae bacterium]
MSRVLVVDNYDSFVFNLVQYLAQLGADVVVRRNDEVSVGDVDALEVDGVLLSPGPGRPEDAGVCVELIRERGETVPILGVCLGHQAIAVAFGGTVVRAPELLHGKVSEVAHVGAGVLHGLPDPFIATRYHSLAVDPESMPAELEVTARTATGVVMGLRHRDL